MQHHDPIPPSDESPLPERLLSRLAGLPRLFTRPTWQNVLLLVAGAILAPGKRTVTAALRIVGREQENDFPIYHGVLNKAVWSSRAVAGWLLRLLVTTLVGADATVVIGIDDTIERRWGRKINARGIYRDPVRSSKGHFVKTSGLRWLSAQLLVHIPWAGRIMGLPFLTVLAPSRRFYAATPRSPKTLLDWARQVALQIHRWLPGRKIVVVSDTAFAAPRVKPVGMHRLPGRRPNLCQCRHPIAARRQSLCPRTAQTTGPRTTGGEGQAPAHVDAGAT
jgi:DDE superfamily endonuclease